MSTEGVVDSPATSHDWACPECGFSWSAERIQLPIRCKCGYVDRYGHHVVNGAKVTPPTGATKTARYLSAVARWHAAGRPTRTDEEVLRIVEQHCQTCQYFRGHHCTHAGCGCNVRTPLEESATLLGRISGALVNKSRMGTEGCPVGHWGPTVAHVVIVTTQGRPLWCKEQDYRRLGLVSHCVDYESREQLTAVLESYKPKLMVNRSFAASAGDVAELSERFTSVNFLTVNHSSQAHLLTAATWLGSQCDFLDLARQRENCWLATPDERHDIGQLSNVERCIWLPNPITLPNGMSRRERGETLHLSLIGRRDVVKNFPTQILAAAYVARQRPVKLWLVVRERADDLLRYAASVGVACEVAGWMDPRELRNWMATEIDVGLQASFSESLNFVGLDHLGLGIPVVGSPAIRYLPREWQANPDSAADIAAKITAVTWFDDRRAVRQIAEAVAERNNAEFSRRILGLVT